MYRIKPLNESCPKAVIDIFNHYIKHEYSAYLEQPLPEEFFGKLLEMSEGFPAITVVSPEGETAGFAIMKPYHPAAAFTKTVEVTYFLHPVHLRKGLGIIILDHLEKEARIIGVQNILASISSLNDASISFHRKHGFEEVGRFKKIGTKFGRDFDVVYMQKCLG